MKRSVLLGSGALVVILAFVVAAASQVEVRESGLAYDQAALGSGEALYSELCAACHGVGGKGDGPAATALEGPVPDLTGLRVANNGVYPKDSVRQAISGEARIVAHGTIDMPIWGKALKDVRVDWKPARREAFAESRLDLLVDHLEAMQTE